MKETRWKAPRYEVETNRHPDLDGQSWGWVKDRQARDPLAYWHGRAEKERAEQYVKALNAVNEA